MFKQMIVRLMTTEKWKRIKGENHRFCFQQKRWFSPLMTTEKWKQMIVRLNIYINQTGKSR